VVSDTTQLKLTASDGKRYNTDVISQAGVEELAKAIRNSQAMAFLDLITGSVLVITKEEYDSLRCKKITLNDENDALRCKYFTSNKK
jgi:hypothetical protein